MCRGSGFSADHLLQMNAHLKEATKYESVKRELAQRLRFAPPLMAGPLDNMERES